MIGINFSALKKNNSSKSQFEQMLDMFLQLLNYTNGDAAEALNWMNELDKQYKFTTNDYGLGDFIEDLKKNNYLQENPVNGNFNITSKTEQTIRQKSLEEIFGKMKKANKAIILQKKLVLATSKMPILNHIVLAIN